MIREEGRRSPLLGVLREWGQRRSPWDGRVFAKEDLWVTPGFLA